MTPYPKLWDTQYIIRWKDFIWHGMPLVAMSFPSCSNLVSNTDHAECYTCRLKRARGNTTKKREKKIPQVLTDKNIFIIFLIDGVFFKLAPYLY